MVLICILILISMKFTQVLKVDQMITICFCFSESERIRRYSSDLKQVCNPVGEKWHKKIDVKH